MNTNLNIFMQITKNRIWPCLYKILECCQISIFYWLIISNFPIPDDGKVSNKQYDRPTSTLHTDCTHRGSLSVQLNKIKRTTYS